MGYRKLYLLTGARRFALTLLTITLIAPISTNAQMDTVMIDSIARTPQGFEGAEFTGEVLPVLYVRDVLASVRFYVDSLGFVCHHFFDHINGGSVYEWAYDEPPIYAEMRAGDQKFAIHLAADPDSLTVGGTRHYFSVADVELHHKIVKERGVIVSDLIERPWMHMYRVEDPDGHELFIFTRPEGSDD
jgi:lactoylglutathione lyase